MVLTLDIRHLLLENYIRKLRFLYKRGVFGVEMTGRGETWGDGGVYDSQNFKPQKKISDMTIRF